ncbi:MAG: 6,7-dimethyl-8-ribityllumazine synthase [Halobacteria archaeon]|nr:6,7-dimethyl-8-ribityllumazine synthase [Halobacteria archaeon]
MVSLGLVVAEFNRPLTSEMEELAQEYVDEREDIEIVDKIIVPGSYDMPLAAKRLCERDDVDAVATIGVVIEGDTDHDQIVVEITADKLADISLEYDKPVTLGVSGPGMSADEARARVEYAERAVESAVEMVRRLE